MFTWMWIYEIVLFCAAVRPGLGQPNPNITTCEEFEKGGQFSPYEVIDSMWKIFYFWANNMELYPISFSLPSKKRLYKFKEVIDVIDPDIGLEWKKAVLFMNPKPGTEVLFLDGGTPGAFRAVVKTEQRNAKVRPFPTPQMHFADVRMKLVGKYLGMMCCEDNTAYALARMDDVPETEFKCFTEASTLGFQGVDGRSYLYLQRKFADEL